MTIRLAPTYSFGFRSRGNVNDAMGRYDFAIADYTKGISIEPRDVGLLIDRGKTLAKAGQDREAIADFSHALDIDYNAVAAFRERGLVYKKLGDISAAIADLTWFTRFEPKDQEVIRAIEEMQATLSPRQAEPEPSRPPETKRTERENSKPSEGQASGSSGTGFFVSMDGYLLTNAHVIDDCSNPQLISGLASPVSARVLATDTANDLALLKGDLKSNPAASFRVGVKVGEGIAVFGYPLVGLLSTIGNFTVAHIALPPRARQTAPATTASSSTSAQKRRVAPSVVPRRLEFRRNSHEIKDLRKSGVQVGSNMGVAAIPR